MVAQLLVPQDDWRQGQKNIFLDAVRNTPLQAGGESADTSSPPASSFGTPAAVDNPYGDAGSQGFDAGPQGLTGTPAAVDQPYATGQDSGFDAGPASPSLPALAPVSPGFGAAQQWPTAPQPSFDPSSLFTAALQSQPVQAGLDVAGQAALTALNPLQPLVGAGLSAIRQQNQDSGVPSTTSQDRVPTSLLGSDQFANPQAKQQEQQPLDQQLVAGVQNLLTVGAVPFMAATGLLESLPVVGEPAKWAIENSQRAGNAIGSYLIAGANIARQRPDLSLEQQQQFARAVARSTFDKNIPVSGIEVGQALFPDASPAVQQLFGTLFDLTGRPENAAFTGIERGVHEGVGAAKGVKGALNAEGIADALTPQSVPVTANLSTEDMLRAKYGAEADTMAGAAGDVEHTPVMVDPNTLRFREGDQFNLDAVRSAFPGTEFLPITTIREPDGTRTILDGHHRVTIASERNVQIPTVDLTRGEYDALKAAGFDDIESAYAALGRANQWDAADNVITQFPGSRIATRGSEALDTLESLSPTTNLARPAEPAPDAAPTAEPTHPEATATETPVVEPQVGAPKPEATAEPAKVETPVAESAAEAPKTEPPVVEPTPPEAAATPPTPPAEPPKEPPASGGEPPEAGPPAERNYVTTEAERQSAATLPHFPTNQELMDQVQREGPGPVLSSLYDAKGIGGAVKKTISSLIPSRGATEWPEQAKLVIRKLADARQQVVAHAMEPITAIKPEGYKVKDGFFTDGVTPRGPWRSLHVLDVMEHADRYDMPEALRKKLELFKAANDSMIQTAEQRGIKLPQLDDEERTYFKRTVKEVRGAEKKTGGKSELRRHYEQAIEGVENGVVYGDNVDDIIHSTLDRTARKIERAEGQRLFRPIGKTASELIDQELTRAAKDTRTKADLAEKYYRTLQLIERGADPRRALPTGKGQMRSIRSVSDALEEHLPGVSERVNTALEARDAAIRDARNQAEQQVKDAFGGQRTLLRETSKAARGSVGDAIDQWQQTTKDATDLAKSQLIAAQKIMRWGANSVVDQGRVGLREVASESKSAVKALVDEWRNAATDAAAATKQRTAATKTVMRDLVQFERSFQKAKQPGVARAVGSLINETVKAQRILDQADTLESQARVALGRAIGVSSKEAIAEIVRDTRQGMNTTTEMAFREGRDLLKQAAKLREQGDRIAARTLDQYTDLILRTERDINLRGAKSTQAEAKGALETQRTPDMGPFKQQLSDLLAEAKDFRKTAKSEASTARQNRLNAIGDIERSYEPHVEGTPLGHPGETINVGRVPHPATRVRVPGETGEHPLYFEQSIADYLKQHLPNELSPRMKKTMKGIGTNKVAATLGDFAAFKNHATGLITPRVWVKAANIGARAMLDPEFMARWRNRPDVRSARLEMRNANVAMSSYDTHEGVSWQEHVPVINRMHAVFGNIMDALKVYNWMALKPLAEKMGVSDRELGQTIDARMGNVNTTEMGVSRFQQALESIGIFAPRRFRGNWASVGQTLLPGSKGALARRALLATVGAQYLGYTAVKLLMGQPPTAANYNPFDTTNFMDITLPEQRHLKFDSWTYMPELEAAIRTLDAATVGDVGVGPNGVSVSGPKPGKAAGIGLAYLHSRLGFLPQLGLEYGPHVLSGGKAPATDYEGKTLEGPGDFAKDVASKFVTISGQSAVKHLPNPSPLDALPLTGYEPRDITPARQQNTLEDQLAQEIAAKRGVQNVTDFDHAGADIQALVRQDPRIQQLQRDKIAAGVARQDPTAEYRNEIQQEQDRFDQRLREIAPLAEQGHGNEWRLAFNKLEAEHGNRLAAIQGLATFKDVPKTSDEWAAYAKAHDLPAREVVDDPVGDYLTSYYALTDQATDKQTGLTDVGKLMQLRNDLASKTDPEIVQRAETVINKYKPADYAQAQKEYQGYRDLTAKVLGMSTADVDKANQYQQALSALSAKFQESGASPATALKMAKAIAPSKYPDLAPVGQVYELLHKRLARPLKLVQDAYRRTHPLIDKYYGKDIPPDATVAAAA